MTTKRKITFENFEETLGTKIIEALLGLLSTNKDQQVLHILQTKKINEKNRYICIFSQKTHQKSYTPLTHL